MYSANGGLKYKDPYSIPLCSYHFSQKGCALSNKCNFSHRDSINGFPYTTFEIPQAKDIRPKLSATERFDAPLCPYYTSKTGCALGYKCNYFHDKREYEKTHAKSLWTKLSHDITDKVIDPIVIGDFIWYQGKTNMIKYDPKLNVINDIVRIPAQHRAHFHADKYSYCKYLDHIYMIYTWNYLKIVVFDPKNLTFHQQLEVYSMPSIDLKMISS